jgi:hypothetical protein
VPKHVALFYFSIVSKVARGNKPPSPVSNAQDVNQQIFIPNCKEDPIRSEERLSNLKFHVFALLHRPTLIGSHNGEFRGQKTAILPVNYQWSHHSGASEQPRGMRAKPPIFAKSRWRQRAAFRGELAAMAPTIASASEKARGDSSTLYAILRVEPTLRLVQRNRSTRCEVFHRLFNCLERCNQFTFVRNSHGFAKNVL